MCRHGAPGAAVNACQGGKRGWRVVNYAERVVSPLGQRSSAGRRYFGLRWTGSGLAARRWRSRRSYWVSERIECDLRCWKLAASVLLFSTERGLRPLRV